MARRRARSVASQPLTVSVLRPASRSRPSRRRARRRRLGGPGPGSPTRLIGVLVVLAVIVAGVLVWRSQAGGNDDQRAAAQRFAVAWARGDRAAMWRALTPQARAAYPEASFAAAYRSADQAAGVRALSIGKLGPQHGDTIAVPVAVLTDAIGTLRIPGGREGSMLRVDQPSAPRAGCTAGGVAPKGLPSMQGNATACAPPDFPARAEDVRCSDRRSTTCLDSAASATISRTPTRPPAERWPC
jgi:hypothetical protein